MGLNRILLRLTYRGRVLLSYIGLIIASILCSVLLYDRLNRYLVENEIRELALESAQADLRSCELVLRDVSNTSKILLSNRMVQDVLAPGSADPGYDVNPYLSGLISFNDNISSVYLFRRDGARFFADNGPYKNITLRDIEDAAWYPALLEREGGYLINRNAGGILPGARQDLLSFFRIFKSLDSQQPVGVVCFNVSAAVLPGGQNRNSRMLESDGLLYLVTGDSQGFVDLPYLEQAFGPDHSFFDMVASGSESFAIVGQKTGIEPLYFVKLIPFHELPVQTTFFSSILFSLLLVNGCFLLFGSLWASKYSLRPIRTLIASMKGVYRGEFHPADVVTANDEIGELKQVYNLMIGEIQALIRRNREEQAALHKAELDIVSAQINPHFLYNTLDSINSLARMGEVEAVGRTIRQLGDFYRISLSDGMDIIPLRKELSGVSSYLSIQELRYRDIFTVEYQIPREALEVPVPKMILQPLVENSLYHGIRRAEYPPGERGLIQISARLEDRILAIRVEDNGAGMTGERLESVRRGDSIGLGATRRRLEILYGGRAFFQIHSSPGQGTAVDVRLPDIPPPGPERKENAPPC